MFDAYMTAYAHAYEHAMNIKRCAHIACAVVIDGKVSVVLSNSKDGHAEINALEAVCESYPSLIKGYCFEVTHC